MMSWSPNDLIIHIAAILRLYCREVRNHYLPLARTGFTGRSIGSRRCSDHNEHHRGELSVSCSAHIGLTWSFLVMIVSLLAIAP